ncbi:zinc finger BED domain-containing protein 4-like [Dendronephthya gigantea]|uniref:zinc finger BED domain-containing protein 4-like n=1 Tax=Dendronephthya gigantea TaxID=151771 RepID=UPI00106D9F3E|nr:zinc finger BED domain-containing protein 4-like [Dendronephthya gigantea]
MARKSSVWEFFKVLEDDVSKAQCLLCEHSKVVVSRGGTKSKQFNTTNLRNHIQSKHPLSFHELSAKDEAKKRSSEALSHGETSGSARKALKSQMSIQTSFDKARIWDINSSAAKRVTQLIGEMIALDNQPFLMVEDLGFQRLMKHVSPFYQLPNQFHFSDKVIPNLFERAKKATSEKLCESESISFTSDIWTCQHTNNSYISLSAHWVSDVVPSISSMQSFVLHSSLFSGSHTGPAIANKFEAMLETWEIPASKCHMVITDNGANMVSGIEIVGLTRGPCFLYTLQLAIQDGIMSQRSVSDMIARSKRVVTHFNHSALACDRLSKIQELNLPRKKLIQDVPTRWNSKYYLLQRLLEMKNAIVLYATEHDIQTPRPMNGN